MVGRVGMRCPSLVVFAVLAWLAATPSATTAAARARALPSNCSQSGVVVTCNYAYSGSEQIFSVPAGVSHVTVTAVGAPGGDSGGDGARVTATVPVPAGHSKLYVEVGGAGMFSSGFNGGGAAVGFSGGGGGASDVRSCSASACSLTSKDTRLVVAGGGGGGSGHGCGTPPPAGQAGDSTVTGAGAGGPGSDTCSGGGSGGDGGFGGTGGGTGGSGTSLFPCDGGSGSLGQGGSLPATCDSEDVGGAGGGGYWGGGAGGDGNSIGGAGGAGSSYWVTTATDASMIQDTTGTPEVVIAYKVPKSDLSLTNSASPNPVLRGRKLTYKITATATGAIAARSVTVSDPLPASVRFGSMSSTQGKCERSTSTGGREVVTCRLGGLGAGKSATVTIAVTPTKAGTLTDTAQVTASNVKPDADDKASATTTVRAG